jgi:ABC-type lipoprotein release transport system permease subunit
MIRHEAMMTSLFGAAGIARRGRACGTRYETFAHLPADALLPVPSLTTFVLVSSIGVVAAVLPVRRAGKLNVLAALSYE